MCLSGCAREKKDDRTHSQPVLFSTSLGARPTYSAPLTPAHTQLSLSLTYQTTYVPSIYTRFLFCQTIPNRLCSLQISMSLQSKKKHTFVFDTRAPLFLHIHFPACIRLQSSSRVPAVDYSARLFFLTFLLKFSTSSEAGRTFPESARVCTLTTYPPRKSCFGCSPFKTASH